MSDKWDKLNKEFDNKLNSMTKEDWEQFNQITMQQTPIELALEKLNDSISLNESVLVIDPNIQGELDGQRNAKRILESLLPYERQYLRDVAEKAWDASEAHLGQMFLSSLKLNHPDKQTYLNQNHQI